MEERRLETNIGKLLLRSPAADRFRDLRQRGRTRRTAAEQGNHSDPGRLCHQRRDAGAAQGQPRAARDRDPRRTPEFHRPPEQRRRPVPARGPAETAALRIAGHRQHLRQHRRGIRPTRRPAPGKRRRPDRQPRNQRLLSQHQGRRRPIRRRSLLGGKALFRWSKRRCRVAAKSRSSPK